MTDTTTARVPAWKRLGLKLKFASDTTAPATTPSTTATSISKPVSKVATQSNPQKRVRDEPPAPEAPAKRVKAESFERPVPIPARPIVVPEPELYVPKRYGFAGISAEPTGKRIVFGDDEDTSPITAAPISTEEPEEKAPKKTRPSSLRKSVSFTPDTKQKDGDTGQQYFKAWASGEDPTAIDPSREEEQASPSKSPKEPTEISTKEPKAKKAKKPKKSKSTIIDSKSSASAATGATVETEIEISGDSPAFVAYLQQHYSDKGNWKFNKKKQKDLLKNIFNVQRLPASYDSALVAYVAGLQGVARERLAAQAEEVLKEIYVKESGDESDAMSLSSPEARKAAYYKSLVRFIENGEARGSGRDEYSDEQLRIMREEAIAGSRAQAFLEKALMMELHPEQFIAKSPTPPPSTTTGAERSTRVDKTKRRKRKTRTAGSDSSEISSSSDSDSDDSESSSEQKPIFGKDLLDQAFPKSRKIYGAGGA